jgi:hypothetical protein
VDSFLQTALSLALFVPFVLTDDPQDALAANNLATRAHLSDRASDFHFMTIRFFID